MIFTKKSLIESVLNEIGIDDVLSPAWQKDANEDMDIEFYEQKTALFWRMMERLLNSIRMASPQHQQQWAYEYNLPKQTVQELPRVLEKMNINWIKSVYPDEEAYGIIKKYGFNPDNEDQMYELAHIELPYIIGQYIW